MLDKPDNPLTKQVGGDHYKNLRISPAEFSTLNSLGFLEGCVIKRMCRWNKKNPADAIEDLTKAKHEIDILIHLYQQEEPRDEKESATAYKK